MTKINLFWESAPKQVSGVSLAQGGGVNHLHTPPQSTLDSTIFLALFSWPISPYTCCFLESDIFQIQLIA